MLMGAAGMFGCHQITTHLLLSFFSKLKQSCRVGLPEFTPPLEHRTLFQDHFIFRFNFWNFLQFDTLFRFTLAFNFIGSNTLLTNFQQGQNVSSFKSFLKVFIVFHLFCGCVCTYPVHIGRSEHSLEMSLLFLQHCPTQRVLGIGLRLLGLVAGVPQLLLHLTNKKKSFFYNFKSTAFRKILPKWVRLQFS